ncbi:MAG: Glu-tRNA(Gln) amidotransferase subunit GatD [Candidatus Nanohaloarchaeota archaeon]|nr:Glu-tRNA(Gln) amidotransferase subunit GatD [Candidatus Nanohaloarchaeota archaeon]
MEKVRIHTKHMGIMEGHLMPKTEYNQPNSIIIKLKSGYNLAINEKDILKIEKLSFSLPHQEDSSRSSKNTNIKDIHIISTGGTIASKIEYETGGVKASFKPEDIFSIIPEIKNSDPFNQYQYSFEVLMEEMSEDLTPRHWEIIAKHVEKVIKKVNKGIIIAHGTDTMHYTSAALSFALANSLNKPVIITGAQRSSDRASSDAFLNFLASIYFIQAGLSPGVYIVMHGKSSDIEYHAHLGTKVKKMHTSRRDAFKSINAKPKGIALYDLENKKWSINKLDPVTLNPCPHFADIKFSDKASLIKYYPGMSPGFLDYVLSQSQGVIIEGTGLGHVKVNGENNLLDVIKKHASEKFIGMCSQTVYGAVHPYVYANLRKLSKAGVVYLEDMICETAYVKLSYALAHTMEKEKIKEFMLTPIMEEITRVW